jgi:hypothetical protein
MENIETKKSLTDHKIAIVETIVNSPVGVDKTTEELQELLEMCADFVFKYKGDNQ